jgi:hypothetical protein
MGERDPYVMQIIQELPMQGHFLEVGVLGANFPRLQALKAKNIHFWGLDTQGTCDNIWRSLPEEYRPNITLIGNEKQDYNWSLLMLIKAFEERARHVDQFDVVYLDGHHTLFVDGLAMFLCSLLVKTGGYLLMDDYGWSLNQQEDLIKSNSYYREQYNFENYTEEQRACSHLTLIMNHLLPIAGKYIPIIENFAWQKLGN